MVTMSLKGLGDSNVVSSFSPYSFLSSTGGLDNSNFVISLYRQALGRQPSGSEVTGWVQALTNGQSRYDVINGFVNSPEYYSAAQGQAKETGRTYLLTQGGGSGYVGQPVVNPSTQTQVNAANQTTASGDTTNTSSTTLSSFTNLLSGNTSIAGHDIPTLALVAGGALALYMFTKRR